MARWFLMSVAWFTITAPLAAQSQPVAPSPAAPPVPVRVQGPATSVAKAPREVDLDVQLIEIRSDLKLPMPEAPVPVGAAANGGVLTKEDVTRIMNVCRADPRTKILCNPRLRLIVGQAGQFRSGGELVLDAPKPAKQSDDATKSAAQTRFFGTAVDATITAPKPGLLNVNLMVEQSTLNRERAVPNGPPGIDSRRVQTMAELASGQTMLLRGLQGNRTTASVTRVPVLGELPVVGEAFFSRKRTETEQTELMLLVTPTAINAGGN